MEYISEPSLPRFPFFKSPPPPLVLSCLFLSCPVSPRLASLFCRDGYHRASFWAASRAETRRPRLPRRIPWDTWRSGTWPCERRRSETNNGSIYIQQQSIVVHEHLDGLLPYSLLLYLASDVICFYASCDVVTAVTAQALCVLCFGFLASALLSFASLFFFTTPRADTLQKKKNTNMCSSTLTAVSPHHDSTSYDKQTNTKKRYLPGILDAFEESVKHQYLLLSSLKEVIVCHATTPGLDFGPFVDQV